MRRLMAEELSLAGSLFAALSMHLAVAATLAGDSPGEVYVDRTPDPRAAVLFPCNRHRVYLAGDPADETFLRSLSALLRERYEPPSPNAPPSDAVLYYSPDAWGPTLETLLADIPSRPAPRQYYRLAVAAGAPRFPPPSGTTLARVDCHLCEDVTLANREELLGEILSESHTLDDFLERKFGYAARRGGELGGWCLSEYNSGRRCELGIETIPRFQRQGVALATASAAIAYAFDAGISGIGWHCWAANVPSGALARRLGFAHVADYAVRYCQFGARCES